MSCLEIVEFTSFDRFLSGEMEQMETENNWKYQKEMDKRGQRESHDMFLPEQFNKDRVWKVSDEDLERNRIIWDKRIGLFEITEQRL